MRVVLKLAEHSDTCKQEASVSVEAISLNFSTNHQLERRSRRKRSDPRKSVDVYKSDDEQPEHTNGASNKRKQRLPKATGI